LGFSTSQMEDVLGLALMQASGSRQIVLGGDPPAKAIYAAFPNQSGVMSALLAERRVGASCEAFEGEAGFFALFSTIYATEALTHDIGDHFYCQDVRFKPWPTSGNAHPFIEAALGISHEHRLDPVDIVQIQIVAGHHTKQFIEPLAERCRPQNGAAA